MEELEYEAATWAAQNERKKLAESEKSPDEYFKALQEAFLDETALYRCFNNKDELLYVGVSYSAINRYSQHKTGSKWAKDVVLIRIEHFGTRDLALAAEKKAIKTEYPKSNKQHNYGERPSDLGSANVCSFQHRDDNGKFVIGGLRISGSPYDYEPLVTYKMDENNSNTIGNALKIYNIFCFKPWEDKIIEIEASTLMSIFGFNYRQECFKDFTQNVIDPAIMQMEKFLYWVEDTIEAFNELEDTIKKNAHCSGKYLTYAIKKTEGYITHVVFVNNKEPTPQPTYLDILADRLGIDREDLRIPDYV